MSDLDPTKLDKLKVAELQEELKARGLDTKGKKAVLVSRLKKALIGRTAANVLHNYRHNSYRISNTLQINRLFDFGCDCDSPMVIGHYEPNAGIWLPFVTFTEKVLGYVLSMWTTLTYFIPVVIKTHVLFKSIPKCNLYAGTV